MPAKKKKDDEENHEERSGKRKTSPAPASTAVVAAAPKKTLSAPVVNATKAAAEAAVAQTPPGKRDKPPESTGEDLKDQKDKRPLTHEVLAEKFKCFTVVKKADYGSHVGIPVNMMQQETVLLCTKCPANKKSGKNWLGTS